MAFPDDDDDFDWDAAVLEIDEACQATAAERSNAIPNFNSKQEMVVNPDKESRKRGNFDANFSSNSSTRQTTLDKFIGGSSCISRTLEEKAAFSCGERMNNSIGSNIWDKNDVIVVECEDTENLDTFVKIDAEAAKTWIYPVNIPRREYQLSITRTALLSNTLVTLPTGLGKTLIAAVVMYNFFRWFPEGKIVFAAPSRPLVIQQIEACHNIVGIPQDWTIDLTGQTSPSRRAELWKSKRVFFVTPQVLEKDIQSVGHGSWFTIYYRSNKMLELEGTCLVNHLVCLVIDEAHRATGNYSYCVAVRELMDSRVQVRILALTATPGSKQQKIQNVIDNLQISTLEYRDESDPDVRPYVHERKIELIQVAMSDEACEVESLLLDVERSIHFKLCSLGLLPKRDIQTLSPQTILTWRDIFLEKPDVLPSTRGALVGSFAALITLYHVRKLLSSHGIRPAFEMLDGKLKKGGFSRMMSRNEVLLKAKLLMHKTVEHGAPSPKLVKMLEVLTDHFKVKDPKTSRVIIFSNFRLSVRDILDALKDIGEVVQATEFIGQTSGKTSKGQSQKVQQAVLQKFRTGGYNVIVATSIGEEGLDIMEVDLVICFDANISPLRMIQRMGRTGRKHEGRVVVLACKGAELKGYTRNQAHGRSVMKHMINGGTKSFNFHPSPRMIPHFLKPELQFLEMSIEEYVPRVSKVKDSEPIPVPAYKEKLTVAEKDLLAKYFVATQQNAWRPSLIAFPHFQAFPSPANKVLHSSRTGLLIDTMQHLQDLPYSRDCNFSVEDDNILDPFLRVLPVKSDDEVIEDAEWYTDPAEAEGTDSRVLEETVKDVHSHKPKTWLHAFLFASEFVSVDDVGNVLVLSLPQLPLNSNFKRTEGSNMVSLHHLMQDRPMHPKSIEETLHEFSACNPNAENEKNLFNMAEEILQSPISNNVQKNMDILDQDPGVVHGRMLPSDHELDNDFNDLELSPRLTNFIKSGVVPESPINNSGTSDANRGDPIGPALVSSADLETERFLSSCKMEDKNGSSGEMIIPCGIRTPPLDCNMGAVRASTSPVPVIREVQTPCTKLSNTSSSKDCLFDSGVKPETVEQPRKFRRLRKLGETHKKISTETRNYRRAHMSTKLLKVKGPKKQTKDVAAFIEDEAEVSSDTMASDDEEDVQDGSQYEDSFIDDGINPTSSNTQPGSSRVDMMAIYRRSLLSQSPFQRLPSFPTEPSPDSVVRSSRTGESGSSTGTKHEDAPQIGLESTARNNERARDEAPLEMDVSWPDSRKRKLSFHQAQSLPMLNLDKEFSLLSRENSSMHVHVETKTTEESGDLFDDDDEFYQGIDLDAIEEEATKLLKQKASERKTNSSQTIEQNLKLLGSPSFDLGF